MSLIQRCRAFRSYVRARAARREREAPRAHALLSSSIRSPPRAWFCSLVFSRCAAGISLAFALCCALARARAAASSKSIASLAFRNLRAHTLKLSPPLPFERRSSPSPLLRASASAVVSAPARQSRAPNQTSTMVFAILAAISVCDKYRFARAGLQPRRRQSSQSARVAPNYMLKPSPRCSRLNAAIC